MNIEQIAREAWQLEFIPAADLPKLERFAALHREALTAELVAGSGEPFPIRLERVKGENESDWRNNISKELYQAGDAVLCWVNEGDLYLPKPSYTADQLAGAVLREQDRILNLPQIKGNLFAEKAIREQRDEEMEPHDQNWRHGEEA